MSLDTKNKNKYGFGVGISTVFEIFGHFLFNRGGGTTPCGHDLHTILGTRNKNIYYTSRD
jgi:hypothetical protein